MRGFLLLLAAVTYAVISFSQAISVVNHSISFTNISDSLNEPHVYSDSGFAGGGLSFVDFNLDGYDDISLTTSDDDKMYFYSNNQQGGYERVYLSGIDDRGNTKQVLWGDIDNDDDYDLFISANDTGNKMYLNMGDLHFLDITTSCGMNRSSIHNNSFGSVFADFNKDGNLDLYAVNRTIGTNIPIGNSMLYGVGDGTFTDVSIVTNSHDSFQAPFSPIVFDYDKDGYEDIYISLRINFTGIHC